jgi:oxygen-independent coproporphyrinogen-3 oxidase
MSRYYLKNNHNGINWIRKQLLEKGPYYTSYPTLGNWSSSEEACGFLDGLKDFYDTYGQGTPIHLYVHVPFCKKLCWYCICNSTITKSSSKVQTFVESLVQEIGLLNTFFKKNGLKPNIKEIHLGGGTPSYLNNDQFSLLLEQLSKLVNLSDLDEFAMEIDPRSTSKENILYYIQKGITRISFGVQDFDLTVQKAINRVQPPELIEELLTSEVREKISGVNFDLLYGLPFQTRDTFKKTLEITAKFSPERITLLKYAHVPDIRKHMRLIKEESLPEEEQLPLIFLDAVEYLLNAGYEWIGIDNFAKKSDKLAKAVSKKSLWRNFNGWTTQKENHLIGIGPTATSAFGKYYFQSVYELDEYCKAIKKSEFPIHRGFSLNDDDIVRREIIFRLICHQEVKFNEIKVPNNIGYQTYFRNELTTIDEEFGNKGIICRDKDALVVGSKGRFAIRNICKIFDKYIDDNYKVLGP